MRLTIVSPSAYPMLVPGIEPFAGGAEFQLMLLARGLRDLGHEISWVVADHGQEEIIEVEGFQLHRAFALGAGNRKLRFVPDMISMRKALRRSRPDIVNQRSTSFYTGQLCRFSHEIDAAFVFSIGSDYNCYRDLLGRGQWLIQKAYAWGIRHADLVLAQTEGQQKLMRANFRRECCLSPNMQEMPPEMGGENEGESILWVGSMSHLKRPELFLEIARTLPEYSFRMVGGPGEDRGYDREIRRKAEQIPNLEFVGFVPQHEMDAIYRHARIYVSTSRLEGLPNTFLQAWSHGVPVVSLDVDPDGVIARKKLGIFCGDQIRPENAIRRLMENDDLRLRAGINSRRHIQEDHSTLEILPRIENWFKETIEKRR